MEIVGGIMEITELEHDALCELANIGLSRAATQLSLLLDDQIEISVPNVRIVNPVEVANALMLDEDSSVAAVWQKLSGDMEGTAMLMFPSADSKELVRSLVGLSLNGIGEYDLRTIEHEAMAEIGNIIIASAMAGIADMLGDEICMSLPNYVEAGLSTIIEQRSRENTGNLMKVIIMFTRLRATRREIDGRMVLLMTLPSAKNLFMKLHELFDGSLR